MDAEARTNVIKGTRATAARPSPLSTAHPRYPAPFNQLATRNHVLTPGRYVGAAEEEEDGEPFQKKIKRLAAELLRHFAESAKAETATWANLNRLGF